MPAGLRDLRRVLHPGGLLSFWVLHCPGGGGIGFIDAFWMAATWLDPEAAALDEAARFPFCTQAGLQGLCADAGITDPQICPIEITTEVPDFAAFWQPVGGYNFRCKSTLWPKVGHRNLALVCRVFQEFCPTFFPCFPKP